MKLSNEMGGMGLRDFRSFNLAILSQQNWYTFQNPNSLLARDFKKKYFP